MFRKINSELETLKSKYKDLEDRISRIEVNNYKEKHPNGVVYIKYNVDTRYPYYKLMYEYVKDGTIHNVVLSRIWVSEILAYKIIDKTDNIYIGIKFKNDTEHEFLEIAENFKATLPEYLYFVLRTNDDVVVEITGDDVFKEAEWIANT